MGRPCPERYVVSHVGRSTFRLAFLLLAVAASSTASPLALPAGEKATVQCEQVNGVLLAKSKDGWRAIRKGDAAPLEQGVFALTSAKLVTSKGLVLDLKADTGKHTPLPVLESAIVLHEPKDVDLDFTLERGIIVLSNPLEKGDLKARFRLRGEICEATLKPGCRMGVELYGRYAPGVIKEFTGKLESPAVQVMGLVLQGKVFLKVGDTGQAMQAPPGASMFFWDNLERKLATERLEKLPEFIKPMGDEEKKKLAAANQALANLDAKDLAKSLRNLLAAEDVVSRVAAVVAAGPLDEIPLLFAALEDEKHPVVRDQAVLVLRHYLGRGPAQVKQVYQSLMDAKLTPIQAGLFLELLLGFTPEQQRQPATYDLLLRLLNHKRLAVRHLAHWHLQRLAVQEMPIGYDAGAAAEERQAAIERWRKSIPPGELPSNLRGSK